MAIHPKLEKNLYMDIPLEVKSTLIGFVSSSSPNKKILTEIKLVLQKDAFKRR